MQVLHAWNSSFRAITRHLNPANFHKFSAGSFMTSFANWVQTLADMLGLSNSLGNSRGGKKLEHISMSRSKRFSASHCMFIIPVITKDGSSLLDTKAWTCSSFDFQYAGGWTWLSGKYSRLTWNVSWYSSVACCSSLSSTWRWKCSFFRNSRRTSSIFVTILSHHCWKSSADSRRMVSVYIVLLQLSAYVIL